MHAHDNVEASFHSGDLRRKWFVPVEYELPGTGNVRVEERSISRDVVSEQGHCRRFAYGRDEIGAIHRAQRGAPRSVVRIDPPFGDRAERRAPKVKDTMPVPAPVHSQLIMVAATIQ